jgi:hypothetical protein
MISRHDKNYLRIFFKGRLLNDHEEIFETQRMARNVETARHDVLVVWMKRKLKIQLIF